MSLWTYAVAAGLVTAALIDALKVMLPRGLPGPVSKLWLGLLVSVALSMGFLYWAPWPEVPVIWALTWGISRVVHSLTSLFQALKDRHRMEFRRQLRR